MVAEDEDVAAHQRQPAPPAGKARRKWLLIGSAGAGSARSSTAPGSTSSPSAGAT